ncbi:hypothetical protein L2E82_38584 [Cichorium intybus]|uniref:Uncharacterized protein n=1 Tax=Cichorium intybus TaxID=13427 RepID=A0ACB9AFF8_CICIN|nr:hypothetical protein L2E82_38584 [Cichorium intybus]
MIREEMSYAKIVKRGNSMKEKKGFDQEMERTEDEQENRGGDAVKASEVEDNDWHEITAILKAEDDQYARNSLVAEVINFDLLQMIYEMPRIEGMLNVKNYSVDHRLASVDVFGVPINFWNQEVFEEIARVREFSFKVRVIEDPSCSLSLTPKATSDDHDQRSDDEWSELGYEKGGMDMGVDRIGSINCWEAMEGRVRSDEFGSFETVRISNQVPVEVEELVNRMEIQKNMEERSLGTQMPHRPWAEKPISLSSSKNDTVSRPKSPTKVNFEAPKVPDLNDSPISSGFFPFVKNVDDVNDEFDLGDEEIIEQTIADEIEKKIRNRRKAPKQGRADSQNRKETRSERNSEGGRKIPDGKKLLKQLNWGRNWALSWERTWI